LRKSDIVSLIGASLSSISIILAIHSYIYEAVRFLLFSYAADILDGWIARRLGESSKTGLMLDRTLDRLSQVIAPVVIYTSWLASIGVSNEQLIYIAIYASILIPFAFYRLIYRVVTSLEYFYGLPLFFHAGLIITSILANRIIHPVVLLVSLTLTILPIKYFRRRKTSKQPSPLTPLRLIIVVLMAIIPYTYNIVTQLALAIQYILITYMLLGPILYYLFVHRPSSSDYQQ